MKNILSISALLGTLLLSACDTGSSASTPTNPPTAGDPQTQYDKSQLRVLATKCRPVLTQMSVLELAFNQQTDKSTTDIGMLGMVPPQDPTYIYAITLPSPNLARMKAVVAQPFGSVRIGDSVFIDQPLGPLAQWDTTFHATGGLAAYYP